MFQDSVDRPPGERPHARSLRCAIAALRRRCLFAWDRAWMSAAYGEEAALHYGDRFTLADAAHFWCDGLLDGWRLAATRAHDE